MSAPSRGINKEQFAFGLMAVALGCSVYYYLASEPEHVEIGDATIKVPPPKPAAARPGRDINLEALLKSGRNPFQFPRLTISPGATPTAEKPVNPGAPPLPPPPPTDTVNKPVETPQKPAWQAKTAADLPVSFMGIAGTEGGEYIALLRNKDGSPPVRVKTGDVIEPSGLKVLKVERERITVEDPEGQQYVLREADARTADSSSSEQKPKAEPKKKEPPRPPEPPKKVEREPKSEETQKKSEKDKENEIIRKLQEMLKNRGQNIIRNSSVGRRPLRNSGAKTPVKVAPDLDLDWND